MAAVFRLPTVVIRYSGGGFVACRTVFKGRYWQRGDGLGACLCVGCSLGAGSATAEACPGPCLRRGAGQGVAGALCPRRPGGLLRWWVRSVRRRLPLTVEELILDAGAVVGPGGAQACAAGLGESGVPAGAAFAPAVAKARLPESRLVTNLGPAIFRNPFSICAAI